MLSPDCPEDIVRHILSFCGIEDLRRVQLTCHSVRLLVAEIIRGRLNRIARLWKRKLLLSEGTRFSSASIRFGAPTPAMPHPYAFDVTNLWKHSGVYAPRFWANAVTITDHRYFRPPLKANVMDAIFVVGINIRKIMILHETRQRVIHKTYHCGGEVACSIFPFYLPTLLSEVNVQIHVLADKVTKVQCRGIDISTPDIARLLGLPQVLLPFLFD